MTPKPDINSLYANRDFWKGRRAVRTGSLDMNRQQNQSDTPLDILDLHDKAMAWIEAHV